LSLTDDDDDDDKHSRSLKVAVQGLDFVAHPLYIHDDDDDDDDDDDASSLPQ
jgi:hypothetical protein